MGLSKQSNHTGLPELAAREPVLVMVAGRESGALHHFPG